MLTFLSYAYSFWLVNSSVESLFPDLWLVYLLRLFVLVSLSLVYIRLEMGICPSSSIYFATTLQVWPARSHVLSSSLLACWPRLLLRDLIKEVYFSSSVSHLPVVKSSLRMYFGALVTPPRYQRGNHLWGRGCFYTKGMMQMQTEGTPNIQEWWMMKGIKD